MMIVYYKFKYIKYYNSFQPNLRATLHSTLYGTEIKFTIGLHPFVKTFLFIWFCGAVVILGSVFVMSLLSLIKNNGSVDVGTIIGIIFPPNIAIGGIAVMLLGKYVSQHESHMLKQFIIDLLDAQET